MRYIRRKGITELAKNVVRKDVSIEKFFLYINGASLCFVRELKLGTSPQTQNKI